MQVTIDTDLSSAGCSYGKIYKIKVYDADEPIDGKFINSKGEVQSGNFTSSVWDTTVEFEMAVYNKSIGIKENITAFAYCFSSGN